MMPNDPIILALESQLDCYQRLAKLAALQHEHVQQSRTEDLLDVLMKRQGVLDEIASFEKSILPARRDWSAYSARLSSDQRQRAERLLGETRRLLEEITAADRNDTMVLQQRKLNLGRQINQASSARQVNRSYAAAAYGPRHARMDVQR